MCKDQVKFVKFYFRIHQSVFLTKRHEGQPVVELVTTRLWPNHMFTVMSPAVGYSTCTHLFGYSILTVTHIYTKNLDRKLISYGDESVRYTNWFKDISLPVWIKNRSIIQGSVFIASYRAFRTSFQGGVACQPHLEPRPRSSPLHGLDSLRSFRPQIDNSLTSVKLLISNSASEFEPYNLNKSRS